MGARVLDLNNDDNNPPRVKKGIPLITRDTVTSTQINSLLAIVGTLLSHKSVQSSLGGVQSLGAGREGTKSDGGVESSVDVTIINACNRLDDILTDKSRWSFDIQELLEGKALELLQGNIDTLKMHAEHIKKLGSPAMQQQPRTAKMPDGRWIAVFGEKGDASEMILGVGDSPEAARASFDRAFRGEPVPEVLAWLAEQEAQPKKARKKKNNKPLNTDPSVGDIT